MLIRSMTRQESLDVLARTRLGRLACEHSGQLYIVPMFFAYDAHCLYAFSTIGKKITWMRANPRVCVEMEELVTRHEWATVIINGRFEELTHTAEHKELRRFAHRLLQRDPLWWEPGYVKTVLEDIERPIKETTYFRIHIEDVSGHRGTLNGVTSQRPLVRTRHQAWLQKLLGRQVHL